MAYIGRDWDNTGTKVRVTKDDFKRIENGIEANDLEIAKQKNPTIPGTLAKQIADNVAAIEENTNKINVCSKNKVLTTLAEVNNPNLESGIYSAEGEGVGMKFDGITTNYYYTLIVNQHRLNAGFGSQMAIPYDSGQEWGVYYRNCSAGVWQSWQELATTTSGLITLNGFTQSYTQCRVSKIGNTYTFNFSIVTTGAIPSGTVIATLPIGFYPTYNFHIPAWAHNVDVPNYVRTWVTTDGNIALHGGDALASGVQLEFSRTIVFE